jgi:hypothetical protein
MNNKEGVVELIVIGSKKQRGINNKISILNFDHIRFLSKIRVRNEGDCWEFIGKDHNGYKKHHVSHRCIMSHRLSYAIFKNKLNTDMVIDHICKNRGCVNPDHLREITNKENVTIYSSSPVAKNYMKTKCINGHDLSGKNLKITKRGYRQCRNCQRNYGEKWILKNKERLIKKNALQTGEK